MPFINTIFYFRKKSLIPYINSLHNFCKTQRLVNYHCCFNFLCYFGFTFASLTWFTLSLKARWSCQLTQLCFWFTLLFCLLFWLSLCSWGRFWNLFWCLRLLPFEYPWLRNRIIVALGLFIWKNHLCCFFLFTCKFIPNKCE